MTELRICEGYVEMDGQRIAKLLPNLTLTLRDRLEEAFAEIDEEEDEAELDAEIERLIEEMAKAGRPQSLVARMARARMRLVAEDLKPDERPT
jgi:hypothetical protein